jgi:pimeloyl-ACP methyl ester carboxylesterase
MATETARVTEKTVNLSHGETHYFEAGSGHPVILLHGSGIEQGGADFLPCFGILAEHFRVLAPNFVGWPPGDTFPDIASFPYLTDFIREFQDALGIQSSHIVGVSMGAWIAGLFAYESSERVDKVVITGNPGLYGSPNRRMSNWQPPAEADIRKWMEPVLADSGIDGEAVIARKLARASDPDVTAAFTRIMKHMGDDANRNRYALERRLPHLRVPVLFLWGKADPNIDHAAVCQSLTPGAELVVLEAGHRLHVENPELFATAVASYLNS